ncbi:MAG TPA: hypothetical protein ENK84_01740, partial [Desulfobulbus sp.]|nr:hypothetical protein [Desulfobulbus sp.]
MARLNHENCRMAVKKIDKTSSYRSVSTGAGAALLFCLLFLGFSASLQARNLSDILLQVEKNTPALQAAHAREKAQQS